MLTDKLNQFVSNVNGQFVEVSDSSNPNQCMDLVYLWIFCLGYPKATIQHLYAYEAYTKPTDLTYKYFDLIPNTQEFIPQDGDICVFKGGIAGHIAICLGGGTTSKFRRFEQNNPLGTHAAINDRGYTNMLGVLRPKVFNNVEPLNYRGYDIHNDDSNKVAVDKMIDLIEGKYISIDEHNKIINELDAKSTAMAQSYGTEKSILEEKIRTLEEVIKQIQDTEHTWSDKADILERKLKAVLAELSKMGLSVNIENEEDMLVNSLHTLTTTFEKLQSDNKLLTLQASNALKSVDVLNKVIVDLKSKQPPFRTVNLGSYIIKIFKK